MALVCSTRLADYDRRHRSRVPRLGQRSRLPAVISDTGGDDDQSVDFLVGFLGTFDIVEGVGLSWQSSFPELRFPVRIWRSFGSRLRILRLWLEFPRGGMQQR